MIYTAICSTDTGNNYDDAANEWASNNRNFVKNYLQVRVVEFNFQQDISRGVIAQLGERYNGIVEVGGSIPPGSTILIIFKIPPLNRLP